MSTVSALALIILYPIRASFAQCGISPHLIKKGTACEDMRSLCDVPVRSCVDCSPASCDWRQDHAL